MGRIGEGVAANQAQANLRLALMLIGIGAIVSLLVVGIVGTMMIRQAYGQLEAKLEAGRKRRLQTYNSPLTVVPANTATPMGNPGDWIGTNDYPRSAIRAGEEGRVRVTLAIGPDGTPSGCSVAASSGSWALDNTTCTILMQRGRFDLARPGGAGSKPGEVRRWTSPSVRWVLPE